MSLTRRSKSETVDTTPLSDGAGPGRRRSAPAPARVGDRRAALTMLIPAGVLVAVFIAYPILDTFRMAVNDVDQFGRSSGFVGLGNFLNLFGDVDFRAALWRTIIWTAAVVGLTIAISLPLAWVL